MIVLTHWIDKYFFTPIEIEGCVSWRKIEDIVCINKWCRRFCKEFDAKFFIYDGHCPKNVKLVFFKYQAIYETTISFQTTEPRTMSPIHEIATADIFDINRYSKLTKYNHDDKTFIGRSYLESVKEITGGVKNNYTVIIDGNTFNKATKKK